MTLLSKSKYIVGLQCLKYFWIYLYQKEKIPEPDETTQYRFDQGHVVGQLAKQSFPSGIDIPEDDFKENLRISQEALKKNKPLFEAAFMVGVLYSRVDILIPVGDEWDIIEVKSGTKVKDVNIHDVAFQKYVYQLAGLKIRKCYVLHINNKFVKKGKIDPKKFFTKQEITAEVDLIDVKSNVDKLLKVMKSDICPVVSISKDCSDPYDCPLEDECWGFLPKSSVFELYRGGVKCFKLLEEGVLLLGEIPHSYKLTGNQTIQRECEIENKVHVDSLKLKKFLGSLKEPVYYLDFETFMTAIPLLEGVRPYQQIPFQWSLHVNGKHFEFLASGGDPRKKFIESLKKVLGSSGSIVVYNQSFEIGRLRELAKEFPAHEKWVDSVINRMVDLIVPFRKFHYYNPKQKGSASLKNVLPAVLGHNPYDKLKIGEGGLASVSYLDMTYGSGKDVRKDLLKYCELDTKAMVMLVEKLEKLVGEKNV
jgi:hypothetical protein